MFPEKIEILGRHWKVIVQESLTNPHNGQLVHGYCCTETKAIYLNKDKKEEMEDTLLHEIGHAVCSEACLHYVHGWSPDLEEILVEQYAKTFRSLKNQGAITLVFKKGKVTKSPKPRGSKR